MLLVTGGCGFIGSHLCEALLRRGDRVRVLDDLSTGSRDNLPAGAELLEGDIADPATMHAAVDGITGCFHLAAVASVQRGVDDWLGTHRTNLTGTIALFDAVRRLPNRAQVKVIYASSAAVYGDCAIVPIVETAEKRPLSAYGADKYGCELHALVATEVYGIPTVGVRLFNVYGPRQDPASPYSGVISIFCDRLRRGVPITVYGDGRQTRDFIFVGDVVAALLAAMIPRTEPAAVLNVCTGQATSIIDLAHGIAELLGRSPEINFLPARPGDIRYSAGDPKRLHMIIDQAPPTDLRVGLAAVLDWLAKTNR